MKITNPLSPSSQNKPPRKRAKKPNKTERFVNALEDKMFTTAQENFGAPLSTNVEQDEVMRSEALGLTNISIRRKVIEYLPQLEQIKSLISQGKTMKAAMEECKVPYTLETRKALGKAFQLDFIIEHRSSPEIERMMVQAARSKFLTESVLRGDSREALRWAQLIQDDNEVFAKATQAQTVMMNKEDLAHFLDGEANEEAIEADFELILEKASEGEKE